MSSETPAAAPPLSAPPAAPPTPAPAAARTPACVQVINGHLRIPMTITDLESFRQWARSDECPEKGRFAFLDGVFWVDLTMEQLYTHNQVKGEIGIVLGGRVKASHRGLYIPDGMLLTNPEADLSTVPDGLFVSYDALQSGRVRQVSGRRAGVIELEGTPEMVLEVVSDTSVEKDTVHLPPLYHRAGIPEFWRVDARGAELRFEVLRRTEGGYEPAQEPDGWWRSEAFGASFQLTRQADPLGQPEFTLRVREPA
jgi:Uma2 family endonuclease